MERHNIMVSSTILKALFYNTTLDELIKKSKATNVCEYSDTDLSHILKEQLTNYNFQELECYIHTFIHQYDAKANEVNFFDILFDFSDKMISYRDENYRFKYEYTDIWRDYTKNVDEETAVISAIFQDDLRKGNYDRTKWDWPYCIEHDNHEIVSILKHDVGVSENHFHLRGASPYFYISWILLMNNVLEPNNEKVFSKIEKDRLRETNDSIRQPHLNLNCQKAAAIRLYLYSSIVNDKALFEYGFIEKNTFLNDVQKFDIKYYGEFEELNRIPVKHAKKYYSVNQIAFDSYKKYCSQNMYIWLIDKVIPCNDIKFLPTKQIQDIIEKWKVYDVSGENIDYAQNNSVMWNKKYFTLSGERSVLYHSLKNIHKKVFGYKQIETLLFFYLYIKHQFRVELVQSNAYIGFHNFLDYQNRKDYFIPWSQKFEERMIADTICSILETPKIHKAELRISPKKTAEENVENIQTCDKGIDLAINSIKNRKKELIANSNRTYIEDEIKNKFFYTLHFIKQPNKLIQFGTCRNQKLRQDIEQQANAVLNLRGQYISTAKRILGIDAAGDEVDCRPETFGSVFRLLQYYDKYSSNVSSSSELRQIKATYHVGEDNYDIVDALRAIDEAILFLGLRSDSRLGHATLLGVSARSFYEKKKNTVHMPRQIFLDNIVWLYFFIKNNNVYFDGLTLLMSYLEEQFQVHFNKIYLIGIQSSYVNNKLIKTPDMTYQNIPQNSELCKFDIYRYYLSWLLRGDDPELYVSGYYKKPCVASDTYKICCSNEKMSTARNSFEAAYLYYLYHYNVKIKELGAQEISISLPDFFVKAVKTIQNVLIKKIEMLGIAIETNPSSNLFISSIESYDEHPISNFYDNRLKKNPNETQLNVSINTDDKSVFSTCLSNEYAYLAFYLENKKDENGKPLYNRFEVYSWLDEIRKMGNEQSFDN